MKNQKTLYIIFCMFFGLFLVIPSMAIGQEPISIGTSWLLTGKWAVYGLDNKKGMEIALEEINSRGVLGRKIEIIWEDSAGDKTVAMALFRKFAGMPKIPLILVVSSAELLVQAPLAKELGVPLICTGSVADGLPLNEWTYRVNVPLTEAVPVLVKGAKEKKGIKKFAIMYDMANEHPTTEAKLTAELVKKDKDLELVFYESFKTGDRDFSAQLAKLRRKPHDGLLIAGTSDEVGLIMKQARNMGIKSLFIGTTSFIDPAIFRISGGTMAGALLTLQFSAADPRPIVQNFVKKYEAKYKESPPLYAALGYDVMLIVEDAIKRAGGLDRKAIRDALAATGGLEALCGRYTYKGHPDNQTPGFKLYRVTEKNEYVAL